MLSEESQKNNDVVISRHPQKIAKNHIDKAKKVVYNHNRTECTILRKRSVRL